MSDFPVDYTKYRVPQDGSFSLADIDPADTRGLDKKRDKAEIQAQRPPPGSALTNCNSVFLPSQNSLYCWYCRQWILPARTARSAM